MTLLINLLRHLTIFTLISFSVQDSIPGCNCPGIFNGTTPCFDDQYSCRTFDRLAGGSEVGGYTLDENPVCDSILTPENKEKDFGISIVSGGGTCEDTINYIETTCYDITPTTRYVHPLKLDIGDTYSDSYDGISVLNTSDLNVLYQCSEDNGFEMYASFGEILINTYAVTGGLRGDHEKWWTPASPDLTSSDWIEPEEGQRYMCKDITVRSSSGNEEFFILLRSIGKEPCRPPDKDPNSAMGRANMMIGLVSIIVLLANGVFGLFI